MCGGRSCCPPVTVRANRPRGYRGRGWRSSRSGCHRRVHQAGQPPRCPHGECPGRMGHPAAAGLRAWPPARLIQPFLLQGAQAALDSAPASASHRLHHLADRGLWRWLSMFVNWPATRRSSCAVEVSVGLGSRRISEIEGDHPSGLRHRQVTFVPLIGRQCPAPGRIKKPAQQSGQQRLAAAGGGCRPGRTPGWRAHR